MITNSDRTFTSTPWRRIFCSLFLVAAAAVFVAAVASSNAGGSTRRGEAMPHRVGGNSVNVANKIAPWVVEHTANGQQAEFFVVLVDQADLSPASHLATKTAKSRFVFETLRNKAQTTQASILQWLRERNVEHQSFYIVNAILIRGTRQVAEALAARTDVARIEGNPLIHNNLPQPGEAEEATTASSGRPATIEPGITYTPAPAV